MGTGGPRSSRRLYLLLNDPVIRDGVRCCCRRSIWLSRGPGQLRLYVGRFAAPVSGKHESATRAWAAGQAVGRGPIAVYGLAEVVDVVRSAAASKTYRDNPVLVTIKVLDTAGLLIETDTSAVELD